MTGLTQMIMIAQTNKVPCKDCGERESGCHSQCERYKAYTFYHEEIKRQQRLENLSKTLMFEGFKRIEKYRRSRKSR